MTDWTTTGTSGIGAPGGAVGIDWAEPLPYTLLPLDRYAKIMGIPPMQFNSAVARDSDDRYLYNSSGACDDIWWDYDWQDNDKLSRHSLAQAIQDTEHDIAEFIGYPVAPNWIVEEVHPYPRDHRPDIWGIGLDTRLKKKGMHLDSKRIIAPGRRATLLIADSTAITYQDLDSDGFYETARVQVATTQTDARVIKVYFEDTSAQQVWEIRPAKNKSISGGTFTAYFWTWQMIHPDTRHQLPVDGEGLGAIDISGSPPSNVVTAVDVYAEYNDDQEASSQFVWGASPDWFSLPECNICGGTGCAACGLTTQNGCFDVANPMTGLVVPWPASYSDSAWNASAFSVCREPDYVKFWYFAGGIEQEYLKESPYSHWIPNWLAQVISYMATARLTSPPCSCGNAINLIKNLMEDMAMPYSDRQITIDFGLLDNPFGTHYGEIYAYNRLRSLAPRRLAGDVV